MISGGAFRAILPVALLCAAGTWNLAAQCGPGVHLETVDGTARLGWPKGQTVKVYFETGQPGDLTSAQQTQFMNGLGYWVQYQNPGSLSFTNAGTSNPQNAANTIYVTVSTSMPSTEAGAEDPVLTANNTTQSDVISLNVNYINGSLPTNATTTFHNEYLSYAAAHEGGHSMGFDDDLDSDGESVMNDILDDDQSNGQDLGSSYISTSSLKTCDQQLLQTQYPSSGSGNSGGGSGGGGGGSSPPTCNQSAGICTNCVPPTCTGGFAWNPSLCECYLYGSPIVIDTDGSGFHLTSAAGGVLFDFYGNGTLFQTAWTQQGSTNGWLALDRNGNGTIDSAKELFGNITPQPPSSDPNGFLALAVYDEPENGGNGDGLIDAQDAIWPQLLVWIDSNHDGISQPGELYHLDDLGIHSISLKYVESRYTDQYGNQFRYKGWLNPVQGDNVDRSIYDVILVQLPPQTAAAWTLDGALRSTAQAGPEFNRNKRPIFRAATVASGCSPP